MTAHNSIRAGKSRQTDSREWDSIKANCVPKLITFHNLLLESHLQSIKRAEMTANGHNHARALPDCQS